MTQFRMSYLTPPEQHGYLYFVTVSQQFSRCPGFSLKIMVANLRSQSYLSERRDFLAFSYFLFFLGLLILVLAIVQKATYRGNGGWGNFD